MSSNRFIICIEQEQIPDDVWGKAKYVKSCRKMGLNPVGSVLRGLRTHRIQVRGRGLNERDALPISFALLVSTANLISKRDDDDDIDDGDHHRDDYHVHDHDYHDNDQIK